MINFLFGWIGTPRYQLTLLQELVAGLEITGVIILIIFIRALIMWMKDKFEERMNKKDGYR